MNSIAITAFICYDYSINLKVIIYSSLYMNVEYERVVSHMELNAVLLGYSIMLLLVALAATKGIAKNAWLVLAIMLFCVLLYGNLIATLIIAVGIICAIFVINRFIKQRKLPQYQELKWIAPIKKCAVIVLCVSAVIFFIVYNNLPSDNRLISTSKTNGVITDDLVEAIGAEDISDTIIVQRYYYRQSAHSTESILTPSNKPLYRSLSKHSVTRNAIFGMTKDQVKQYEHADFIEEMPRSLSYSGDNVKIAGINSNVHYAFNSYGHLYKVVYFLSNDDIDTICRNFFTIKEQFTKQHGEDFNENAFSDKSRVDISIECTTRYLSIENYMHGIVWDTDSANLTILLGNKKSKPFVSVSYDSKTVPS